MMFSAFDRASFLALVTTAFTVLALPSVAKTHGARDLLKGYFATEEKAYDRAIEHYTRAIGSDDLSLQRRSDAYRARGDVYFYLERLDRAFDDYNLALHLNPRNASALNNRGNAFTKKGAFDLAMSDFNVALRLDPSFALAHQNRANLHFYFGRFHKAAQDYAISFRLDPSDPFSAIWLYLSRKRGGKEGRKELKQNVSAYRSDEWTSSIVALFLGDLEPDQFLARVKRSGRASEVCEAHFYVGQVHLLDADRPKAIMEFRRALEICPVTYVEHTAAKSELLGFQRVKRR